MSREIEFRVWDSANKKMRQVCWMGWEEMIYWDTIEDKGQVRPSSISAEIPQPDGGFIEDYFSPENDILMQYTGIKDKNGVKIFEGDVVVAQTVERSILSGDHVSARLEGIIAYYDNSYCISKDGVYYASWTNAEEVEVIGNIHENKELLND